MTLLALAFCVVPLCMPNAGAQPSGAKSYKSASVPAVAGSQCKLHESGAAASAGLPVFVDDDDYARFYAVRATAGDAIESLILDCTDSGKVQYLPG